MKGHRGMKGQAGWAIMLADLALIMFIVTAQYASADRAADLPAPDPVPQAFYRALPDAPPLGEWLRQNPAGAGASLQITIGYDPANAAVAMDQAARLAAEAAGAGAHARIVLIPDSREQGAVLAYDH
ncbi:hypothetical protein [Croceicoccus sp. Ery15]|uniref:hypothetical protein n=1 Tax=Croceicoccus sp. Ery15 TaxID=1703338 RepID=UPI001E2A2D70|nr:hypothetical protein [Croceicoccus sp. Ery15]